MEELDPEEEARVRDIVNEVMFAKLNTSFEKVLQKTSLVLVCGGCLRRVGSNPSQGVCMCVFWVMHEVAAVHTEAKTHKP